MYCFDGEHNCIGVVRGLNTNSTNLNLSQTSTVSRKKKKIIASTLVFCKNLNVNQSINNKLRALSYGKKNVSSPLNYECIPPNTVIIDLFAKSHARWALLIAECYQTMCVFNVCSLLI